MVDVARGTGQGIGGREPGRGLEVLQGASGTARPGGAAMAPRARPRAAVFRLGAPDSGRAAATDDEMRAIGGLAAAGIEPLLVDSGKAGAQTGSAAEGLCMLCERRSLTLSEVAVVATAPADIHLALEAGLVVALEDAGGACVDAADVVVARRGDGGVAQAVAVLTELAGGGAGRD